MTKKKIYETSFNEMEFIAVTAYQNEEVRLCHRVSTFFNSFHLLQVKSLKIRHNPFAKAFLETSTSKR